MATCQLGQRDALGENEGIASVTKTMASDPGHKLEGITEGVSIQDRLLPLRKFAGPVRARKHKYRNVLSETS